MFQVNGYEPHASSEQIESLETLKEYMISSKGPLRDPSGLSASGLSEGQLSEAAQYFLTNLERLLHASKTVVQEVAASLPFIITPAAAVVVCDFQQGLEQSV